MEFKKITRKITVLDRLASKILSPAEYKAFSGRLIQLKEAIEILHINSKFVREWSIKRTKLIDKQIEKEVFEGKLHDQYHLTTKKLETQFNNFFLSIKTVMNRIPNLAKESIGKQQSRSLKVATFGKFLNKFKRLMRENQRLNKHFSKAIALGVKLDEEIITYRDKFIEHVQHEHTYDILSSEGPASVTRTHLSPKSSGDLTNIEVVRGKPHWVKFDLVDESNIPIGYYYYVHFSISKEINGKRRIKKGEPIGRIYDSNLGHFKKWGAHIHVFSTPNLRKPNLMGEEMLSKSKEAMVISPEVQQAERQTLDVVWSFLVSCFNYLQSTASEK